MRAHIYLLLLSIPVAATCGGGGDNKPITVAEFCAKKAAAECVVSQRCGVTLSMTTCESERTAVCMAWTATVQAPRVFVAGNVGRCVDTARNVYSKSTITPTDLASVDDACNYVFQGSVDKLMTCAVKYDCANNRICDKTKCADKTNKNLNDLCGNPGEVCNTGSYCKMDMTAGTFSCVAKGGQGATCDPVTAPCLENLRCAGTCTDRVTMGGSCGSSDDCAPAAPYCNPFSGKVCDTGLLFAGGSDSCRGFTNSGVTAGTTLTTSGGTDAGSDTGASGG